MEPDHEAVTIDEGTFIGALFWIYSGYLASSGKCTFFYWGDEWN